VNRIRDGLSLSTIADNEKQHCNYCILIILKENNLTILFRGDTTVCPLHPQFELIGPPKFSKDVSPTHG
jgi:hypothetical protein